MPNESRLTVVDQLIHQVDGAEQATECCAKFSKVLKTSERAYGPRQVVVSDEDWSILDLAWIKVPSMVKIVNDAGRFADVRPTDEERRAETEKIVDYGQTPCEPFGEILPGESARFRPYKGQTVYVRCRKGETRISVTATPD